jgi:hypothetical protein
VAGEAVLIPLLKNVADLEAIYTLNEVGVFIWERLENPVTIDELTHEIMMEFEVDQDVLEADMKQFIHELKESKIILEVENESL